ncbi:MAG: PDDEXK nuclease domain-containing protein [Bacteroidales bacterium]|nr:PDDEXK nuclease domain-containing protein [Bacteroidales bacterium]
MAIVRSVKGLYAQYMGKFLYLCRMSEHQISTSQEREFFAEVKGLLLKARQSAYAAINAVMTQTYWQIGKRIVEQEQKGKDRAEYGAFLIKRLARSLAGEFGEGLSVANLKNFRQFYLTYPEQEKSYTLCSLLSWSHIRLIMRREIPEEREYYIAESSRNNWSVRTLERHLKTDAYHRLLSQSTLVERKEPLAQHEIMKDPYVLEFLGIKGEGRFLESEFETAIINHIEQFLLELGSGFSFVGRQMRISTETSHFYVDLVFYNYLLKCFVLIDLKTDKLTHQDIGQMEMYVRMFDDLKRQSDDNPTIGLILCKDKDETLVKYSVLSEARQIFASKYKLILPSEERLIEALDQHT